MSLPWYGAAPFWAAVPEEEEGPYAEIPNEGLRLSETKAEGGNLHGVKVNGGAVGGGRGQWIHQCQRRGLQGDQVQALE